MTVEIKNKNGEVIYTHKGDAFYGERLVEVNLRGAELSGEDFWSADLRGSNLALVNFKNTSLNDANLSGTDLRDADLTDANLGGADLQGADLSGACFKSTCFYAADLRGTGLTKGHLSEQNARFDDQTQFDQGETDMSGGDALRASAMSKLTPAEKAALGYS